MPRNEWNEWRWKSLEEEGCLTPEDQKPEWLRNLDGSGPPRTASWVPANNDGTPKLEE